MQLSGTLVKKRNLSYYGMSIIYIYLCIFYWSQRSRFSQTRELSKSWPIGIFCMVSGLVIFVHFFLRLKLLKNCACLVEVHKKKNAGIWSNSLYTCQIYFAFLKKLYCLYSFSKSVAFLSMIPKANILRKGW